MVSNKLNMKTITTVLLVMISLMSFGQIETKYYLDVNDGDSLLMKFTYQNHIKSESSVAIHYKKEVFDLDTTLLKSNEIRGRISLNDSIQSQPIDSILTSIYNQQDQVKLKSIMKAVIRKERRGKY